LNGERDELMMKLNTLPLPDYGNSHIHPISVLACDNFLDDHV